MGLCGPHDGYNGVLWSSPFPSCSTGLGHTGCLPAACWTRARGWRPSRSLHSIRAGSPGLAGAGCQASSGPYLQGRSTVEQQILRWAPGVTDGLSPLLSFTQETTPQSQRIDCLHVLKQQLPLTERYCGKGTLPHGFIQSSHFPSQVGTGLPPLCEGTEAPHIICPKPRS